MRVWVGEVEVEAEVENGREEGKQPGGGTRRGLGGGGGSRRGRGPRTRRGEPERLLLANTKEQ